MTQLSTEEQSLMISFLNEQTEESDAINSFDQFVERFSVHFQGDKIKARNVITYFAMRNDSDHHLWDTIKYYGDVPMTIRWIKR